jgi:hypothetical protein
MPEVKERPILFSAPMVRALLAGTKTQTRRVCKAAADLCEVVAIQDPATLHEGQRPPCVTPGWFGDAEGDRQFFSPYGAPGDQLWVREAWGFYDWPKDNPRNSRIVYRADGEPRRGDQKWRPSIHMTRAASRILLGVTEVRVQRLQDINEADAIAEGCHPAQSLRGDDDIAVANAMRYLERRGGPLRIDSPVARYMVLWESINGAGSWEANPWVWAVSFKRLKP